MSTRDIRTLIKNRSTIKKKLRVMEKFIDSIKTGSVSPELSNVRLIITYHILKILITFRL